MQKRLLSLLVFCHSHQAFFWVLKLLLMRYLFKKYLNKMGFWFISYLSSSLLVNANRNAGKKFVTLFWSAILEFHFQPQIDGRRLSWRLWWSNHPPWWYICGIEVHKLWLDDKNSMHIKSCFGEEKNGEEYVSPDKHLFFNKIYYQ